ncbi:DNA polymerase III chi subunit [Rhodothalassium salexigens DSM 2132]|uniref:DNA polymerase III chi subunit n=1 Tax=Rhodothalassium salexigens DSM 2132 TaxID=1188247 RepID=A0A4R2PRR2_RHOSA|nr:DNA polymerase III subunit chi [Rhodothalassium salexigens]MBB4210263.1 DNA polymerase-3 subunit chi [Rhodothalassium salexigens DSM 2132]MBK1638783.1 DNA polymerase III subunit chi [Rhodothalassium salexigens DSM 2132]TCP38427.1 DNA polymerase III chi subunit [Rhodothalassium salexigens DSM 2132]
MTEVRFYHLQRTDLTGALPKLLEKVLQAGQRALVRTVSDARVADLDRLLWTYDPASFLPHGTPETGFAERQPVYVTAGREVPNGAGVLILVDGVAPDQDVGQFARCCLMFDGRDEAAVADARGHWKRLKEAGHTLSYWQQGDQGGWRQRA